MELLLRLLVSYMPLAHDSCRARASAYCSHNSRATALWHRIDCTSPRALRRAPLRQLCTAALHALLPGALVVHCSGDRFCAADGVFEQ